MDFWFALTGGRPVFPYLASAILTLLSLALALPIYVAATIEFLGANIIAFCELVRPEPPKSQNTSPGETRIVFPDGQTRIQPDDSESYENLPKFLYDDDDESTRYDDSDPIIVGSISPKSVDFSLKPTNLFLETIDFSPKFSESEVTELLHDEWGSLFFNDSDDEDRIDERESKLPSALGLCSDVPVSYSKPSQTSDAGFIKVNFGRSSAGEAKAGDDLEDTDESEDEEEDEDEFAEVKQAVDLEAVKKTAIICRAKQLLTNSRDPVDPIDNLSCEIETEPMYGSYNLVYVMRWSDGVKWVVRIPRNGCCFAMLDVAKMESTYGTMELIRKNTTMPIPEVYLYTWMPDRAGVPFALMSFVEGKMLFNFWHQPSTTKEQKLATLTSIAKYMVDLSKLEFPDTGMLYFDSHEAEPRIGPVIETIREGLSDLMGSPILQPRCNSIKAALSKWLEDQEYRTKRAGSHLPIFRAAIDSIPDFMESKTQYTICFPDFDWQNIMVNDNGEITGFIDWDDVEIKPMSYGAAKYPCWLTRDWHPVSYGWGLEEEQVDEDGTSWREESPEQLSMYRQHYLEVFTASQQPEYDSRWTKLSHILDALSTGIYDNISAGLNINKLFRHGGVPFELADYADSFVEDGTAEKDQIIQQAFKKMWHAEWEEEETEEGHAGLQNNADAENVKDEEV